MKASCYICALWHAHVDPSNSRTSYLKHSHESLFTERSPPWRKPRSSLNWLRPALQKITDWCAFLVQETGEEINSVYIADIVGLYIAVRHKVLKPCPNKNLALQVPPLLKTLCAYATIPIKSLVLLSIRLIVAALSGGNQLRMPLTNSIYHQLSQEPPALKIYEDGKLNQRPILWWYRPILCTCIALIPLWIQVFSL